MVPECRHIKTSGEKCGSPALRGKPYCYFHARLKERVARLPRPFQALDLPPLEDRGSIQIAISEIVSALASYTIDPKRAGILLYALQIASHNAKDAEEIVCSHAISEVTCSDEGQEMAPEGAIAGPPPEETETLASILVRAVREEGRKSRELNQDQTEQIAHWEYLARTWEGEGVSAEKPEARSGEEEDTRAETFVPGPPV